MGGKLKGAESQVEIVLSQGYNVLSQASRSDASVDKNIFYPERGSNSWFIVGVLAGKVITTTLSSNSVYGAKYK